MGRLTKEHKFLTSNILGYLLEPEEVQKKLEISLNVLESFRKTRNSDRKKKYKEQLINIFKHLCLDSYKLEKSKEAFDKTTTELEERISQKDDHAQSWKNKFIKLEMKIQDSLEYRQLYEDQKKTTRSSQKDYNLLLRENDRLLERIKKLKEQNKDLKKQIQCTKKQ